MKVWQLTIALLVLVSCTPKDIDFSYTQAVGSVEKVQTPITCPEIQCKEFDIGTFVRSMVDTPSPTSNLKYVTQTNNKFEVKYGDGEYHLLGKDTTSIRLACDSGESMLPTFNCDDTLIIREVEAPSELNLGDIILFRENDGGLVIHRLFSVMDGMYQTKADNLGSLVIKNQQIVSSDTPIKFEQIIAKVVGIIYK